MLEYRPPRPPNVVIADALATVFAWMLQGATAVIALIATGMTVVRRQDCAAGPADASCQEGFHSIAPTVGVIGAVVLGIATVAWSVTLWVNNRSAFRSAFAFLAAQILLGVVTFWLA